MSSTSSSSSAKRRKVSPNDNTKQSVIRSSSNDAPTNNNNNNNNNTNNNNAGVTTRSAAAPKLSTIANLVLVELQKKNTKDVVKALQSISDLLPDTTNKEGYLDEDNEEWQDNKKDFMWTGGVAMIVVTMRKWPMNLDIQGLCLEILCGLTSALTWREPICVLVKSGGVDAIVNALQVFPDSLGIQDFGLLCIDEYFLQS